jgi:hypothetical protein
VQYLSDQNGDTQAVQSAVNDLEKILLRLKKYEQLFKIKSDLKKALDQVEVMRKSKTKKQTLSAFLHE